MYSFNISAIEDIRKFCAQAHIGKSNPRIQEALYE